MDDDEWSGLMFISFAMTFSGLFMLIELLLRVNKYTSRFLAITPLFFLFCMVAFNRMSRDYLAYQRAFWDISFRDRLDFGYAYLVKVVDNLGGDQATIAFIAGVFLIFVLLKILKTSNYVNVVVFFYCAFPLIFDVVQTRNFLMYLIVIFSLSFVERNKPFKHYFLLFIAFSIHKFALIYIPFYYLCKKSRKEFTSTMIKLSVLLFISSPLVSVVMTRVLPEKTVYLMSAPRMGAVANFIYVIVDILTVWWVDKKIAGKLSEQDNRKMEILYRFVWFPILILPVAYFFVEVVRLQRNVLLVKYIYCALAMKYLNVKQRLFTVVLLLISITIDVVILVNANPDMVGNLDDNFVRYYLKRYLF